MMSKEIAKSHGLKRKILDFKLTRFTDEAQIGTDIFPGLHSDLLLDQNSFQLVRALEKGKCYAGVHHSLIDCKRPLSPEYSLVLLH